MTKLVYSRWLDSVISFLFLFNLFLYLFAFFLFAILSTLCTPNPSIKKKTVTTTTTKTTTKRKTISHYRTSLVNEKTIKQFYSKKYMLSTVIAIIKSITVTISQNDIKYYLWKKGENITKPEEHLYL